MEKSDKKSTKYKLNEAHVLRPPTDKIDMW